jgi:hypothetical protein
MFERVPLFFLCAIVVVVVVVASEQQKMKIICCYKNKIYKILCESKESRQADGEYSHKCSLIIKATKTELRTSRKNISHLRNVCALRLLACHFAPALFYANKYIHAERNENV